MMHAIRMCFAFFSFLFLCSLAVFSVSLFPLSVVDSAAVCSLLLLPFDEAKIVDEI